jgi:hypothetical protein
LFGIWTSFAGYGVWITTLRAFGKNEANGTPAAPS